MQGAEAPRVVTNVVTRRIDVTALLFGYPSFLADLAFEDGGSVLQVLGDYPYGNAAVRALCEGLGHHPLPGNVISILVEDARERHVGEPAAARIIDTVTVFRVLGAHPFLLVQGRSGHLDGISVGVRKNRSAFANDTTPDFPELAVWSPRQPRNNYLRTSLAQWTWYQFRNVVSASPSESCAPVPVRWGMMRPVSSWVAVPLHPVGVFSGPCCPNNCVESPPPRRS